MGRSRMARVVALLVLIGAIALGSTDGVSDLDGRVVPLNEEQQALRLMEAGPGADLQALRQKALKKAEEVRELEQEKAKLEAQDAVATAALKPKARPGTSTTPIKQAAKVAKQMLKREVAKARAEVAEVKKTAAKVEKKMEMEVTKLKAQVNSQVKKGLKKSVKKVEKKQTINRKKRKMKKDASKLKKKASKANKQLKKAKTIPASLKKGGMAKTASRVKRAKK